MENRENFLGNLLDILIDPCHTAFTGTFRRFRSTSLRRLMMNLQEAIALNLPHLTPDQLSKVRVRYAEGKPVAIIIAVGDALPDVVVDYEILLENGFLRERRAEKEKVEYREMLRDLGLNVAQWDAVLRSGKRVRQHEDTITRMARRRREIKAEKAELKKTIKRAEKELAKHGNGTHLEWEAEMKKEIADAYAKLAELSAK